MDKIYKILAINPGSTSTKVAVFENERVVMTCNVAHDAQLLKSLGGVQDQLEYRRETVENALREAGIDLEDIDVFVGRGGGLVPSEGGIYEVTERVLQDTCQGMQGEHPAQLGSQIASLYARQYGGRAFIVNSPDTDEMHDIARVTGLKDVWRAGNAHTLNQKEIALRWCASHGKQYEQARLIICHIGGGVSVAAHMGGKMVDTNSLIKGSGPMAPTRAGSLPTLELVNQCYSGQYTHAEMQARLLRNSGLIEHLGTSDAREVEARIAQDDAYAKFVYDAMIYQLGKSVGEFACVLKGRVDAIILTGGLAHSKYLVNALCEYIAWIAEVVLMPGEFEMEALASGGLRAMTGQEKVKEYTGAPTWSGFQVD